MDTRPVGPPQRTPDAARLARLTAPVAVEVTVPVQTVTAPAVLGHPELGTDRLVYVPRLRLAEPVVYVARDPATGDVLYVGMTTDMDARRWRHETESAHGTPGRAAGSNVPLGAHGILRAEWLAVPVPAEHARALEEALSAVLRPVLATRRATARRLTRRHGSAMVAAGWTEDAAAEAVRATGGRP